MAEMAKQVDPARYCEPCAKEFATTAAKKGHDSVKHSAVKAAEALAALENAPVAVENKAPAPVPAPEVPKIEIKEVLFYSPRAPFQTVIVKPTEWVMVESPAGTRNIQVAGKEAQFDNGTFRTSDPEIIEYLEKKYSSPRYPIVSARQLAELGAK